MQLALERAAPTFDRLKFSSHLAEQMPWNAEVLELYAVDLAMSGHWEDAIIRMQAAINANPAYLPRRQRLVSLMKRAAENLPTRARDLERDAELEKKRIGQLDASVHPRNRLPKQPASGFPVQPAP